MGVHDAPIRCVEFCNDTNVVITGSWDATVKLWDPRGPTAAGTFTQPDKVFVFFLNLKYTSPILSSS